MTYKREYVNALRTHFNAHYRSLLQDLGADEEGNVTGIPSHRGGDYNVFTRILSSLASTENYHTIYVNDSHFTIEHPIREKLTGELQNCSIFEEISWAESKLPSGTYKAYEAHNCWEIFPIEEESN